MRKKEDATTLLRILLHLSIHYKTNPVYYLLPTLNSATCMVLPLF